MFPTSQSDTHVSFLCHRMLKTKGFLFPHSSGVLSHFQRCVQCCCSDMFLFPKCAKWSSSRTFPMNFLESFDLTFQGFVEFLWHLGIPELQKDLSWLFSLYLLAAKKVFKLDFPLEEWNKSKAQEFITKLGFYRFLISEELLSDLHLQDIVQFSKKGIYHEEINNLLLHLYILYPSIMFT